MNLRVVPFFSAVFEASCIPTLFFSSFSSLLLQRSQLDCATGSRTSLARNPILGHPPDDFKHKLSLRYCGGSIPANSRARVKITAWNALFSSICTNFSACNGMWKAGMNPAFQLCSLMYLQCIYIYIYIYHRIEFVPTAKHRIATVRL